MLKQAKQSKRHKKAKTKNNKRKREIFVSLMIYNSHRLIPRPIPTTASIAIITAKIITANKEIAKAFNHPESKKCFTKPSKIMNRIIDAIIPENKELNTVLITVPRITIHTAPKNRRQYDDIHNNLY